MRSPARAVATILGPPAAAAPPARGALGVIIRRQRPRPSYDARFKELARPRVVSPDDQAPPRPQRMERALLGSARRRTNRRLPPVPEVRPAHRRVRCAV